MMLLNQVAIFQDLIGHTPVRGWRFSSNYEMKDLAESDSWV